MAVIKQEISQGGATLLGAEHCAATGACSTLAREKKGASGTASGRESREKERESAGPDRKRKRKTGPTTQEVMG